MNKIKNYQLEGKHQKPILIDVYYNEGLAEQGLVLFCHGYKGYKDWGAWHLAAARFVDKGYLFISFNFSHNGGTPEQPIDFPDLEAFGMNNYMKEYDDLQSVLDWLPQHPTIAKLWNGKEINLIGHSRGGGIAVLTASKDQRINKLITWASVSDFGSRFPTGETLEFWKKNGVAHIINNRTQQEMPHYFQFYENFKANEDFLFIQQAAKELNKPYLILHGDQDETVHLKEAKALAQWSPKSELRIIDKANHTFGTTQPYTFEHLPEHFHKVVELSLDFLQDDEKNNEENMLTFPFRTHKWM